MRRYEMIVILSPDLNDEGRQPVVERFKELIATQGGALIDVEEWGSRKLAYAIKKKMRGFYLRFDFGGSGQTVDEIERFCRIDDRVFKYLTVLLDKEADVEQIIADRRQQEAAAAEAKAAAVAKAQADAAAAAAAAAEAAEAADDNAAAPADDSAAAPADSSAPEAAAQEEQPAATQPAPAGE